MAEPGIQTWALRESHTDNVLSLSAVPGEPHSLHWVPKNQ